ncbi:MAG TPA: DUF2235 domain-containing protein, partial [Steroidobacter sp.]|nr:DUF2235 domain-containing protein [Steroidobacter sp.]
MEGIQRRMRQQGAAIAEAVIALPVLLAAILGAVQFGFIYQAKATLNHASLLAARAGAVAHAEPSAIRLALARGLAPLHSPDSSLDALMGSVARIEAELATNARIRILNPTREAFEDFAEHVNGVHELPNDRLHARSTAPGPRSGLNIQDANILRVQVTYGYELKVPLVNWFIARTLLSVRGRTTDAFERQLLQRTLLPIVATATVRMQSPARLSDLVVSRADLPEVERFDAASGPQDEPDEPDDPQDDPEESDHDASPGSNLGEGFLGFGEGAAGGAGGAGSGEGGDADESGPEGGENAGSPRQCPASGSSSAFATGAESVSTSSGASLPGVDLPSLAVGNPVHVATGNKYQHESDIPAAVGPLAIAFSRHYNSELASRVGVMGAGWRHSYEARLLTPKDGSAHEIAIVQSDGRLIRFAAARDAAGRFLAQRASDGELETTPAGRVWRWPSGRRLLFDASGLLREIQEGMDSLQLSYDEAYRLTSVTDPQSRVLRFFYYENGRLASVAASHGMRVRYEYDQHGNLARSVDSADTVRSYHYEDSRHPNHLTGVSVGSWSPQAYGPPAPPERLATWAYDDQGRSILYSGAGGAGRIALSYAKKHTDVIDAFGRSTRYVLGRSSGVAYVAEVRGPGCGACTMGDVSYEYDEHFQLTSVRAKDSPAIHWRYDELRRLVELRRAGPAQRVVRFAYEGASRRPTLIETASVNSQGRRTTEIRYREDGQLTEIREHGYAPTADGAFTPIERRILFDYTAPGRLTAVDGPREGAQDALRMEYDAHGLLLAVTTPDGDEARVLERDALGRATRIVVSGSPEWRLLYDAAGRIVAIDEVQAAGARSVRFEYDVAGRLHKRHGANGEQQQFHYDPEARTVRRTDSRSHLQEVTGFAADGQLAFRALLDSRGAMLRMLNYVYDVQRRLIEVRDGDGPPMRQLVYEDSDRLPDRAIDPMGTNTLFGYDSLQRLVAISQPDAGDTRLAYDFRSRLSQRIAPNGARTSYEYDDFGRLVLERSPDRGVLHYRYNAAGQLIERIDARGQSTKYWYTPGGRLSRIAAPEGETRFTYERGRLSHAAGPWGEERYKYNHDGDVREHVRRISGLEFKTRRTYDGNGRLLKRELPSGALIDHEYDAHGALTSLVLRKRFGVDKAVVRSAGRPLDPYGDLHFGNGLELRTRVDIEGRLRSRALQELDRRRYTYDPANRIALIETADSQHAYEYDRMHRLVAASTPAGRFEYAYDANGNRTEALIDFNYTSGASSSARAKYAYRPASNRLVASPLAFSPIEYDAAGHPLRIDRRRYEYNSAGRPVKLFVNEQLVAEYHYNVNGERTTKTLHSDGASTTTHYLYESGRLIGEADARGRITREYLYLGVHPVGLLEGGNLYWVHTDHRGAPIAVTNERRTVVWRAEYEPFGVAHVQEDPDGDGRRLELNLRLPGQYADAESGTYYNLMRDYAPALGRYLTPDPLGSIDGPNPYAYVRSNPVMRIDPWGLYLFAFDGTWIDRDSGPKTNVELFRDYYDPSVNERNSFYVRGIGAPDPRNSDFRNSVDRVLGGVTGYGGRDIIDQALQHLDTLVAGADASSSFDGVIDIIGFSRGAALARAFANEVFARLDDGHYDDALASSSNCRVLRIRFMGLFDTVAAFGIPGNAIDIGYDLTIDDRIGAVAHAVALNEHRAVFDLVSIQYSEFARNTTPYRIEAGFLGAHSDIGGGYEQGDLSDVALHWMHSQAVLAGVRMQPLREEHLVVTDPIIHDERLFAQDREIFYPNDPGWRRATCPYPRPLCAAWRPPATQRQSTAPQFRFPELAEMIRDDPQPNAVRGTVDMEMYMS